MSYRCPESGKDHKSQENTQPLLAPSKERSRLYSQQEMYLCPEKLVAILRRVVKIRIRSMRERWLSRKYTRLWRQASLQISRDGVFHPGHPMNHKENGDEEARMLEVREKAQKNEICGRGSISLLQVLVYWLDLAVHGRKYTERYCSSHKIAPLFQIYL